MLSLAAHPDAEQCRLSEKEEFRVESWLFDSVT